MPPVAFTLTVPFICPKQMMSVAAAFVIEIAVGSNKNEVEVALHPLASETVMVYVFPAKFIKFPVMFVILFGIKLYEIVPTPPVAVAVSVPLFAPLQVTEVLVMLLITT